MTDNKATAAELRSQADLAEYLEYLEDAITRQKDRIVSIKAKLRDKREALLAAEERLFLLHKELEPTPENIAAHVKKMRAIRNANAGIVGEGSAAVHIPTGTVDAEGK